MTDIVREPVDAAITKVVAEDIELGERAHLNYGGILEAKCQVGRDFLVLGRLLKENRDKKYFKALGHDTFEDFLGSPDIAMSRSMVFDLIRAVEVFIDKLARPMDELAEVGISKLSAIAETDKTGQPVVYQDPDEWMSKAKELSRSDLQEEVHEATGKPYVRRSDAPRTTDWRSIRPGENYVDYVRECPCAICNKPATEAAKTNAAHFPVGRGAGAPADWVIPMCGDCHAEHHHDPNAFMVKYARQWGSYFYRLVAEAFDLTRNDTAKTTKAHEDVVLVVDGSVEETEETLLDTTPATDDLVPPPSTSPLLPPDKNKSKSLRAGSGEVVVGQAPVPSEDSGLLAASSSSPSPAGEPKQIWPPAGGFERCYACHLVLLVSDLDGGLCEKCRLSALFPAPSDVLAFLKPVAAKRRGKKGGRK